MLRRDHDRLELGVVAGDQPREAHHLLLELGHPQVLGPDLRQVLVEAASRVVAADLRAVEDPPVPLGQLPQPPARLGVAWFERPDGYHRWNVPSRFTSCRPPWAAGGSRRRR